MSALQPGESMFESKVAIWLVPDVYVLLQTIAPTAILGGEPL